jgi:ankyrin repeat protein
MTYDQAHRAIRRGQIGILANAIPSAISVNAANRRGWTLLMLAAIEGNRKIGALLIARGADVAALDSCGESALSLAAFEGHLPFVKLLKSNGASGDVHPYGYDLEYWLRIGSGLPEAKIKAIMAVV